MTIWNVVPKFDSNDAIHYQVLPYSLEGSLKCMGLKRFLKFFKDCFFSEKKAREVAEYKNNLHNIQAENKRIIQAENKRITNYQYIQQNIINNKQKLALFLAQIEDANEWAWTAENSWLPWLDEECKLDYDDYEKYFK